VRSDHPMIILLYILCIMLCVPLFFLLSLVLKVRGPLRPKDVSQAVVGFCNTSYKRRD
jgi:hypothetical protein